MRTNKPHLAAAAALVCAFTLFSGRAQAAPVFYYLTQVNESNVGNAFPSGTAFAEVKIERVDNNTVRFTVTPNDTAFGGGNTVKVFQFGFNYNAAATGALTIGSSQLPSGWSNQGSGNMDGFGSFEVRVGNSGAATDKDPLIFTVDTANTFANEATQLAAFYEEGNKSNAYSAHMRGFNFNGTTSAFFADGNVTVAAIPAPAGAVLGLAGLGSLGGFGLLRRRLARK